MNSKDHQNTGRAMTLHRDTAPAHQSEVVTAVDPAEGAVAVKQGWVTGKVQGLNRAFQGPKCPA